MAIKDRVREVLESVESIVDFIGAIKSINDEMVAEDVIEEILNFSDDCAELTDSDYDTLNKELDKHFGAVFEFGQKNPTKQLDACDEINDIMITIEQIIHDRIFAVTEKQFKKLQELSEWVSNLQKQIDNCDLDILGVGELVGDMDWYSLGVHKSDWVMPQPEQQRLFALESPFPRNVTPINQQ